MRASPYGTTPLCQVAFALGHQGRRFALLHAAKHGFVSALDIQREFADYDRLAARDMLHVLRDRGVLQADKVIPDVQGGLRQLTYILTPQARQGVAEMTACLGELTAHLEEHL